MTCDEQLAEAKRAFTALVGILYQREYAYQSVIDGMTAWLAQRIPEDAKWNYMGDTGTATEASAELDRLKAAAASTLESVPRPEQP